MAELPTLSSPTRDAIFAAYEAQASSGFRAHLGASLIGKDCERALWFDFRWTTVHRHPGRLLRLFETGQLEEARLVRNLRSIGATVLEVDPETDQPRGMTITLSDWVYEGIMAERSLLTMHPDYFLLTGGLERALYRIARKHAGNQRGGWTCRVEVLRDKTGSDSKPKEFNRMLRKIVEANQLPDYAVEMVATNDGSPAIQFRLRGEAEALALSEQLQAEQDRRDRMEADRRRTAEVDDLMDRLSGRS